MADKVPDHCGVGRMLFVKNVTLESISDSTCTRLLLWQKLFITVLYLLLYKFLMLPDWEILLQKYLQDFAILHALDSSFEGRGI